MFRVTSRCVSRGSFIRFTSNAANLRYRVVECPSQTVEVIFRTNGRCASDLIDPPFSAAAERDCPGEDVSATGDLPNPAGWIRDCPPSQNLDRQSATSLPRATSLPAQPGMSMLPWQTSKRLVRRVDRADYFDNRGKQWVRGTRSRQAGGAWVAGDRVDARHDENDTT